MKLIIDTDPGVDDALAIALAQALPAVDFLGMTTVFGNTFVDQSSRNARYIADLIGADVPVAQGAALPFGADEYTPSAHVHGHEGLGDITTIPQIGTNLPEDAADYLCRMAADHPGEVTVCAIGPLTNIALAVRRDPAFATRLKQLVIMGGAFECPGNVTPVSEANIYHDIAAADEVFAAGFDLKMVGLNATMQTLLTVADFARMAELSRVGAFVSEISAFYLEFYRSVGVTNGCPMHDATAVLACVWPERFTWHQTGIAVDGAGTTIADARRPLTQVAMEVEAAWAVQTAMQAIATYPR